MVGPMITKRATYPGKREVSIPHKVDANLQKFACEIAPAQINVLEHLKREL